MDLIKKLFSFNNDDTSAIGLCRFNDDFFKEVDAKENIQKKINKDVSLTEMLKKNRY